jgi:hypothetical protein
MMFLLVAGASRADLAPIGLSEVQAQWFDNEDLFLYGPEADDLFAVALAAGDFNGDGAMDLASGMPYDDEIGGGCEDCGMVIIRYGSLGTGLVSGLATTVLHEGINAQPGDLFGAALVAGDFNHDLYDDLAVGVPMDGEFWDGGRVLIFFGAPAGIQTNYVQSLNSFDVEDGDSYCDYEHFGEALATGDFGNDGYADLAIGMPSGCEWYDTASGEAAEGSTYIRGGAVVVAHGTETGLLPFLGYRISQDSGAIVDSVEEGDQFGRAVAAGDFNFDGFDDLAIGVAAEGNNGAVQIVMGAPGGLYFPANVLWEPGALGELPEAGDRLGFALASADFDGDHYADLAIGNPSEDFGPSNEIPDVGSITVAYGSPAWFDLSRTGNFWQGSIYGNDAYDQAADRFGWALAAGDFDGDGRGDLAVGHPGEDVLSVDAGAVTILMGAGGFGLVGRYRYVAAGISGIPGINTQGHQEFGRALVVGDFDGTGFSDLVIGAPRYDAGGIANVGGEAVLYGALFADGFEITTSGRWSSTSP